jgi:hypothetical protein
VCGIFSLASDEEVLPLARRVAIYIERSNTSASDLFDSVYSAKIKAQSSGSAPRTMQVPDASRSVCRCSTEK